MKQQVIDVHRKRLMQDETDLVKKLTWDSLHIRKQ